MVQYKLMNVGSYIFVRLNLSIVYIQNRYIDIIHRYDRGNYLMNLSILFSRKVRPKLRLIKSTPALRARKWLEVLVTLF
jgi:hypothetical protein